MTELTHIAVPPAPTPGRWIVGLAIAAVAWVAAYAHLTDFADAVVAAVGLERGTYLAEAVHFFFYDTPKVLLLVGIVFPMGMIQTFFSPQRTRALLAGIALGAAIHGYVPQDFMASIMGKDAPWWSVPAAVALGVPMYANAAGIFPVVEALIGKGAALGTVLAFMMSAIALSAPEMIILRKVLKPRLCQLQANLYTDRRRRPHQGR
ncbi:MAG: permease [Sulfuritalea sp.]|nr:permease [Sulfuritalea sp.]